MRTKLESLLQLKKKSYYIEIKRSDFFEDARSSKDETVIESIKMRLEVFFTA